MLNIYARSFMTATRSPCLRLRDAPAETPRRRWNAPLHWLREGRCADPRKM
jgi:hypothetical protein